MYERDCAYNPSIWAYERVKDCEIDEYLKNFAFIKSIVDDLVIM